MRSHAVLLHVTLLYRDNDEKGKKMQIEGRNAVLEALKKEIPLDVIYV